MSEVSTSRRDVMRALAVVPTIIAVPTLASPAATSAHEVSHEWSKAVAQHRAAGETADRYYEQVFRPAWEAWRRAVEDREAEIERRIAAVPHYVTKAQTGMPSKRFSLSTEHPWYVSLAKNFTDRIANGDDMSLEDPEFVKCCTELWPAAQEREAKITALRSLKVAEKDERLAAVEAEYDRLENLSFAAFDALRQFKPTCTADLIAKVEFLKASECVIDADDMLAALRAIAGEAAA